MTMRKIIAMLSAVLMLCAVVPFSVSAAPGDVILQGNFDDGNGVFSGTTTIEGGVLHWDTSTASWAHLTKGINVSANTKYEVTFKMKSSHTAGLSVKFMMHDWQTQIAGEKVTPTSEWADYSVILDSGNNTSILFMIQANVEGSVGQQVYIDDFKIVEYTDPATIGQIVNGSFEDGTANWKTDSSASLYTADAYEGSNSLKLENTGYYASAATQTISVKANTDYELVWYSKRLSGSGAFNIILCQSVSPWTNYEKVSGQNWMNETSGNWVRNSYAINTGDNTSMLIKWTSERSGDAGAILLDAIQLVELKDPSFDGYITNGDFETGKTQPWDVYSGTAASAEAAKDGEYGMKLTGGAGYGGMANQDFTVVPGTTYTIRFDLKVVNQGVNVQIKDNGANVGGGYINKTEWTTYSYEFTPSSTNANLNFCGSGNAGGDVIYLDNVMVYEKVEQSNDGYIVNGTFDTGALTPWKNLWDSCPTAEVVVGGKDSTFALHVVSGQWKHVRQMPIAVEPNTDYKITVWSKNSANISLLVKGLQDDKSTETGDIKNVGLNSGAEWTQFTNEFNSGDHNYIIVSFMGNTAEGAEGYFDTVVMEKLHTCEFVGVETKAPTCGEDGEMTYSCTCGEGTYTEAIPATGEHVYFDDCSAICEACGYEREVSHNIVHVEAVAPTCIAMGNIEFWYCDVCGQAWLDEACTLNTNMMAVKLPTIDHTYADDFDANCDVCGETREITAPVVFGGNSISEDVNGLAFKFDVEIEGIAVEEGYISKIDYTNATYGGYKLIKMGVIASNEKSSIEIEATHLFDLNDNGTPSVAYRIINIPEANYDDQITMKPYFVVEIDGVENTIYGEEYTASYNKFN